MARRRSERASRGCDRNRRRNGLDRVQFRFQWVTNDGSADADITGATGSSYTLVAADEGKTVKVRVSFTDRGGYAESLTSAATDTVSFAVQQQVANSPATGAPANHRHGPGRADADGGHLGHRRR